MQKRKSEIMLLKDNEWSVIDGEPCRVNNFNPLGSFVDVNNKVHSVSQTLPYASIILDCKKLGENITGFITHKIDFFNLWLAFKERTIKENEEVIIFWTKKHYKIGSWVGKKLYSTFMPKLWVMVCLKGAFELMSDSNCKPELTGEKRWNAMKPLSQWKPEVMD